MVFPKITIPSEDTPLLVACTRCNHQELLIAKTLLRGTDYICENCGAHIQFSDTTPPSRATVRVSTVYEDTTFEITIRSDGAWVFLDDGERSLLDVLDHDSDRSVAVITASMIENRLERAIRNRSRRDKKIEDRLFHLSGPLGTFGAKIDVAYLAGIISTDAHRDLVIFKDIRNLFAHNLGIKDFRSQKIKDKTKNLRLVDNLVADYHPSPDGKGSAAVNFEPGATPVIFVKHASSRKKRARDRYLMTAQLLTVRFALVDRRHWPVPLV